MYGIGERIKLPYTRAMVRAVLNGQIDETDLCPDGLFGLSVPCHVPDVPNSLLHPDTTWNDGNAYRAKAYELISRFEQNFNQFSDDVLPAVSAAGPHAVS